MSRYTSDSALFISKATPQTKKMIVEDCYVTFMISVPLQFSQAVVQTGISEKLSEWVDLDMLWESHSTQGRVQDLRKVGAEPDARRVRAQNFSHAPKTLTTPLIYAFSKTT